MMVGHIEFIVSYFSQDHDQRPLKNHRLFFRREECCQFSCNNHQKPVELLSLVVIFVGCFLGARFHAILVHVFVQPIEAGECLSTKNEHEKLRTSRGINRWGEILADHLFQVAAGSWCLDFAAGKKTKIPWRVKRCVYIFSYLEYWDLSGLTHQLSNSTRKASTEERIIFAPPLGLGCPSTFPSSLV